VLDEEPDMLKRKAYAKLDDWKRHKTKQALLITGARQVGKTYLVDSFAKQNYKNIVRFNLVEDAAAKESFGNAANGEDLLLRISIASTVQMTPGETVVFVDEVQECPEIVTLIKFLVEKGDYDFILSGSLLGVELENIRSNPVGYVTEIVMYPLDFEEFCWANGLPDDAFDIAQNAFSSQTPVPDFLHERFFYLFHRYLLVGGMPDAVVAYRETNALGQVRVVQNGIVGYYGRDISKYALRERRLVIRNIYDLIPSELLSQNRRFRLSSIENVKRFAQVQEEFLWLAKANVALPVYNVKAPVSPLLLYESHNLFKLYLSDVGLLTSRYPQRASVGLLDGNTTMNLGGVYENFAAQEFTAHGFGLRYYSGKRTGEIDFVLERKDGNILAMELKSGSGYRTHAALTNALEVPEFDIAEAYVLAETNVEQSGGILYLPVYFASLFHNV
jgi:predicted AAA+ superfamily ATPase